MPQMTNMDISFVSLVKKGANKQKIQIYKADDSEEPEVNPMQEDELKGFFNVLKSFFTGTKKEVTKAEKKPPTNFAAAVAVQALDNNLDNARWTLRNVINNILIDETITDKKVQIGVQIDAYKAFVLSELDRVGIKKFAEDFQAEPIEKAGKKVSAARLESIKNAIASLQCIVTEVEAGNEGGEGEVKKEELAEIVKGALTENLKPITDRLDKIEKGEDSDTKADPKAEINKEDIASIVKSALGEALKPIETRLDVVEKSRGISKASEKEEDDGAGEGTKVNKSTGSFDGFFV